MLSDKMKQMARQAGEDYRRRKADGIPLNKSKVLGSDFDGMDWNKSSNIMTRNEEIILAYKAKDLKILEQLARINVQLMRGKITQEQYNEQSALILKDFCARYHEINEFQNDEELRYFDNLKINNVTF